MAWLVPTNPMPHEALIRMLGEGAYPFGGFGTIVPEHKEIDARNKLPLIEAGGPKILEEVVRRLGARASPRQPSARS